MLKRKRKALILGDGGAAKAIKYALNTLAIEHKTVSRKSSFDYSDITSNDIEYYNIIINTTPLGSLPYINETPNIPYQSINSSHLLYDLNYNPVETKFLSYGKNRNIQTKNGLEMLHIQAEESWKIWNSSCYKYL